MEPPLRIPALKDVLPATLIDTAAHPHRFSRERSGVSEEANDLLRPLHCAGPVEWIERADGRRIPFRRFDSTSDGRPVVLLHGLQSHSGWFIQSASRAAAAGVPAYAFDRCGNGQSRGPCDPGPRLRGLLDEIDIVVDYALEGRGQDSVFLLGHCFGAIPALLYAGLHRPERVAGLVLATPALYTHTDLPARDKARVFRSVLTRRPIDVPVRLRPEDFSEVAAYQNFVRTDPLVRHEFGARFLFELRRARTLLPEAADALRAPLLVAMAGQDVICDNPRVMRLLERARGRKEVLTYDDARHVLEFSGERDSFLDDLAGWLTRSVAG